MRHEYDTLIRHLADATHLDFYYVERMLKALIKDTVEDEIDYDEMHQQNLSQPTYTKTSLRHLPKTEVADETRGIGSFTPSEVRLLCKCINRYGSANHPYATPKNIQYFVPKYIEECVENAYNSAERNGSGDAELGLLCKLTAENP